MDRELERVLLTLVRSQALRHRMGPLLHALLLAQLLAGSGHDGPPHAARRAARTLARRPQRRLQRGSQSGRRPRG
jgi:hypothetical protein